VRHLVTDGELELFDTNSRMFVWGRRSVIRVEQPTGVCSNKDCLTTQSSVSMPTAGCLLMTYTSATAPVGQILTRGPAEIPWGFPSSGNWPQL